MANTFNFALCALFTLSPVVVKETRLRVVGGIQDDGREFAFAVMLQRVVLPIIQTCSGSLIAPTWVLTAGHCSPRGREETIRVKYWDTTIPSNETKFFAIIKATQHTSYKATTKPKFRVKNDIGLLKIERISNLPLAKLSAVDYAACMGLPVKYAGFGRTKLLLREKPRDLNVWYDLEPPLLLGQAVVISCKQDVGVGYGKPNICVAPRCGPRQQAYFGDSGGPLLYNGRLIGVCSGSTSLKLPIVSYTPVSPFLDWIYDTMNSG